MEKFVFGPHSSKYSPIGGSNIFPIISDSLAEHFGATSFVHTVNATNLEDEDLESE